MITVRRAELGDVVNVAAAEKLYIDCPWSVEQVKSEMQNPSVVFLTAEENGEFVGYVSGEVTLDECEISNIAVVESYRRRGAGEALFKELITRAARLGVKSLFLIVRRDNEPATALYTKFGFVAVGTRKGYYKGSDGVIMRKDI